MTAQEQQMLQGLTTRVQQTQLTEKDPEAEQYLAETLGRNPDSLYILAQTVLVQQYALDQAQKQLADLKAQAAQHVEPKHATSFLGNLLGLNNDPPPPPPPPQQYTQPQYAPVQYAPAYTQPGYGAPQQGGFLRSAMQTATGVAAGALAFEGIESLMHGFGGHSGGGFGSDFAGGGRPEEIINNNYYGDSGHSSGLSSDIEDRRGESKFSDAVDNDDHGQDSSGDGLVDSGDQGGSGDDFSDTSGSDDSSSFDDGGGFDSGGGSDPGSGDGGF